MPAVADKDFDEWTDDFAKLRKLGLAAQIHRKAINELKAEMPPEKHAVVAQTASTARLTARALLFSWVPPLSQVELRS
jgi:hypothetical protein